ncbi:MAG: potassium-transporting ATPase subunit F [Chloroflexota bacterium]
MNWLYLIVGIITLAILVYLIAALLKPEWFS